MAKKLTDLSQLTKAILKESPHPAQPPLRATASQSGDMPRHFEKPAPEPSQSREDADAAAVLACGRVRLVCTFIFGWNYGTIALSVEKIVLLIMCHAVFKL